MVNAEEVVDDSALTMLSLKVHKDLSVESVDSGGASNTTVAAQDLLPGCAICGKRFQSAKAVHGHMRIHVLGRKGCVDKETRELMPRRDVLPSVGKNPSHVCRFCRKSWPSRRLLLCHLRSHIHRTWRDVHPPAANGRLSSGWVVTGKRGRQSNDSGGMESAITEIASNTYKESDSVKDSLRFMAMNDKGYLKISPSLPDEGGSVSGVSDENKKDAGVKVEIKMPQDEKPPLDAPGVKAEEAESKNYTCSRCHKSFSKYQSLGGHRSSCNKSERCTAAQTLPELPQLDLSLSLWSHNSSPSNEAEPGGQKMEFDLNVCWEMSPEESRN